jgi:hypothetical protein
MKFFLKLPLAQRLGAVIALLLLLLGFSTTLSLTRIQRLDQQVKLFELNTVPSVRLLHDMSAGVEDLRGMAALHLLLSGTAEVAALEAQMLGQRQRLDARLAACAQRLKSEADQRHHATVRRSVARFWVEQDRLLLLSRQAAADPVAAAAARLLLTGPAQQAYRQLGDDLEAWWLELEQRAERAAHRAHADAANMLVLLWGLAAVGAAAALAAGLAVLRGAARPLAVAKLAPALAPLTSDKSAAQSARAAIRQARASAGPQATAARPRAGASAATGPAATVEQQVADLEHPGHR